MSTKLMFLIILFFLFVSVASSAHFLGGTINWRVQNSTTGSTSVAIRITQTYSWTYTTGKCENGAIANSLPVPSATGSLTCSPSCPAGFGTVSATPHCTDVSSLNGIVVGQRTDTVVIPEGSDFSMVYASSAWGGLTIGAGAWSITSHVKLGKRSDNGMFNNAPVATVMSPINIERNQRISITVSASDPDGDIVRCRWATASNGINECGSVCPPGALPANTVIHPNCTIEITGSTVGNRFAVALMVEDFINSTSTIPLSSVPVQFIVKVIAPPTCLTPPETMLTGASCTPVKVNQTFTSQLLGVNNCGPNISIIDIATLSFPGMIQGPLTKLSFLIYYKTITWTPTIDQLGFQVMCAMALDSEFVQSPQHCFTFYVTQNGTDTCPGFVNNVTTATPLPTTLVTTDESTTTISMTTQEQTTTMPSPLPTSHCISWPLFASLAALSALAMACNCCLLHHHYQACYNRRRRRRNVYNHNPAEKPVPATSTLQVKSAVVPIEPVYNVQNEDSSRPTVQRIRLAQRKTSKFWQRKVASNDNVSSREPITTSANQLNLSMPSFDTHANLSVVNSSSFSPKANKSTMHGKNGSPPSHVTITKIHSLPIKTNDSSPKVRQARTDDHNHLRSYFSVPAEYAKVMNNQGTTARVIDPLQSSFKGHKKDSSAANVSIRYAPRPKH